MTYSILLPRLRRSPVVLAVLLSTAWVAGCGTSERPSTTDLGSFGVDLSVRDETVAPGENFFQYASGAWLADTVIPPDRARWGAFDELRERMDERVRGIIDELAAEVGGPGRPEQQVGDYYASWMDTAAVNGRGITPLLPDLDRIADVSDLAGLISAFGRANYVGSTSPIYQTVDIDREDPDSYVLDIGLGGLGLPDRDYYLDESDRFARIREEVEILNHSARNVDWHGKDATLTSMAEKRRSSRIVPIGSNEDVVIIHLPNERHLAKILDLSDGGVCVYLVEPEAKIQTGDRFPLSVYHKEQVKDIEVQVCRRSGQVVGLEFCDLEDTATQLIRAKIIRLEVEMMRVRDTL
jgi:hypothetical protein